MRMARVWYAYGMHVTCIARRLRGRGDRRIGWCGERVVATAAVAVVAEGGTAAEAAAHQQLLGHAVRVAKRLERGAKVGVG